MQAFAAVLLGGGCASLGRQADLAAIYNQPAQFHDELRNPVIVIPGILGSKLYDRESDRVVWGAFSTTYADPRTADGARLVALPMREGAPLNQLRDGVEPRGVLDRVKLSLVGLPLELNAYYEILASLGVGGYRDELLARAGAVDYGDRHFSCFQFDYDWRLDLPENARLLHQFIETRRAYVREQLDRRFGPARRDVKFDIVAHSMGGLLARYYLRFGPADLPADGTMPPVTWKGATHLQRVILIGTPNAGSVEAFTQLLEGATVAPILPTYPPAVVGTMPAVYQLLPRSRHQPMVWEGDPVIPIEDILDPALWREMGWGMASPRQDKVLRKLLPDVSDAAQRRRIALDHQKKCLLRAKQFHAAMDQPATPPDGVELYLIAGDAEPTSAVAVIRRRTGLIVRMIDGHGDGTVLRTSALLDERVGQPWSPGLQSPIAWRHATFFFKDHLGLTKDPTFTDNVLFLLLERRAIPTTSSHQSAGIQ